MSMHEKEGLVEDSVHLVAKSSMTPGIKRDVLFNLYRFQAMFDTGYAFSGDPYLVRLEVHVPYSFGETSRLRRAQALF